MYFYSAIQIQGNLKRFTKTKKHIKMTTYDNIMIYDNDIT